MARASRHVAMVRWGGGRSTRRFRMSQRQLVGAVVATAAAIAATAAVSWRRSRHRMAQVGSYR